MPSMSKDGLILYSLYENGGYWVDLDMICIKKLDFKEPFIFSSERTIQKGSYAMQVKYVPNIGVLKAPTKSEFYKELYEKCMHHQKSPLYQKFHHSFDMILDILLLQGQHKLMTYLSKKLLVIFLILH